MLESPALRRALLLVARETARKVLGLPPGIPEVPPKIAGCFGGAFVTFWAGKRLRGCVGTFVPTEDIVGTIQEVTRQSLADSRFVTDPIRALELDRLDIEISILSDLKPTADPLALIPGTHGILVKQAGKSGCFLPKVASERGWTAKEFLSHCCVMKAGLPQDGWRLPGAEVLLCWTAKEFLSHCCVMKAGLPQDGWRLPGAEVLLFTAEVFGDPEFRESGGEVGVPQVS
jgi:AmmeMemoRadiSam system protein A